MAGLASRAFILSISRLANYGLMLISPIILVRLISVEDFGRYREFVLYASVLQTFAGFTLNESLLYFVPAHTDNTWRIVRQTAALTMMSSVLVLSVLAVADLVSGGALVGEYLVPLVIYVLFFVNLDFWEYWWLGRNRALPVFMYSVGRLTLRLVVVVGVAALTTDVEMMIWSLCALEGVRIAVSAVAWRLLDRSNSEVPARGIWREQLRFCLPAGFAAILYMATRNLGNLAVAKALGVTALAHYTIGLYGEPILLALRNSVSTVLLPEMVSARQQSADGPLRLWQRALVVNCILLFPVAIVLARFAEPIVVGVFGDGFRAAAPVLQIYALVIVRQCFDFSPPLRAINRTRPLVSSNATALVVNAVSLLILLPYSGIRGAAVALVIANYADALYLGWRTTQLYDVSPRRLLLWPAISKVGLASLLSALVIASSAWVEIFGLMGVLAGSVAYALCFAALLRFLRVQEAAVLLERLRTSLVLALRKVWT